MINDIKEELERNINLRVTVDKPLINWFLVVFLLSWLTFGIAFLYLFIIRITRIDKFICRKREYYRLLTAFTEDYAKKNCQTGEYPEKEIHDMGIFANSQYLSIKPLNWPLTIILMVVTLGLYFFIYAYKMNRIWNDLQLAEREFYNKLSVAWISLGIIKEPVCFIIDRRLETSYLLNIVLSVLTLGLWLLLWDYRMQVSPEAIYPEIHKNEDIIYFLVSEACNADIRTSGSCMGRA